jgi:hypothetical protein
LFVAAGDTPRFILFKYCSWIYLILEILLDRCTAGLLLQEILLDDQIIKLGVNIGGDVMKLGSDYGAQVGAV